MELTQQQHKELLDVMTAAAQDVLGNPDDAYDVAMDAYIEMLEGDITHPFTVGPSRARSRAANHLRNEGRRREIERESGEEINRNVGANWSGDDPAQVIEAEEGLEAINNLSPKLRRALWQHVVEGISYAELAEAEGVSEAVMRKRVQRAKDEITNESD